MPNGILVDLENGTEFESKKAANEYFSEVLNSYRRGEVVTDQDHIDNLSALLRRYDGLVGAEGFKLGVGVDGFSVRSAKNIRYNTKCFWLHRTDGTETDFGIANTIDGKLRSVDDDLYDAAQRAIDRAMRVRKRRLFEDSYQAKQSVFCEVTGQTLSFSNADLRHHNPAFSEILDEFRRWKGWESVIPSNVITPPADAQTSAEFLSESTRSEFEKFHAARAVLGTTKARTPLPKSLKIKNPIRIV